MPPTPAEPGDSGEGRWPERFWEKWVPAARARHQRLLVGLTLGLVLAIGWADYVTGSELSLLVFYFLPVGLAVVAVSWQFGIVTSLASVGTWFVGDLLAGAHYGNPLIPWWNALIALGVYLVVVWLLSALLSLHREMDERIRQRTRDLLEEIRERERLEKAIIDIGERERRGIGRDLHDGLGQHLTGTALVAQAVANRLSPRQPEEAPELRKVVQLIEQGITQTRDLARGLLLAEIENEGLEAALRQFASSAAQAFRTECTFTCTGSTPVAESSTATHLYRIAQEAVRNAARHGKAGQIHVELTLEANRLEVKVADNGQGLPPPESRGAGLGLRIMAHRASMIGARFSVAAQTGGGTLVHVRLP